MLSLSAAFAAELKRVLDERGMTVTEAARSLQISRQALYNHLKAISQPRAKLLARATELWNIEIQVGQSSFDKTSFEKRVRPQTVAKQLNLWDHLDQIKEKDLQIGVKRVGRTLRVSVQIGIPA